MLGAPVLGEFGDDPNRYTDARKPTTSSVVVGSQIACHLTIQ